MFLTPTSPVIDTPAGLSFGELVSPEQQIRAADRPDLGHWFAFVGPCGLELRRRAIAHKENQMAATLFAKYGGFASIRKIVMLFDYKALDSDILVPYFEGVDIKRLIDHQTKFIAALMGGPASYTYVALGKVHAHLDIGGKAMTEVAMLLEEALEDFDFAAADIDVIRPEFRARAPYVMAGPIGG